MGWAPSAALTQLVLSTQARGAEPVASVRCEPFAAPGEGAAELEWRPQAAGLGAWTWLRAWCDCMAGMAPAGGGAALELNKSHELVQRKR